MSPNFFLILGLLFLFSLSTTIHAHSCTKEFSSEAKHRNIKTFCKRYKESNGVEIAMNLSENSRRLDIMVGARLLDDTGWLAWGLNLGSEARMVGTQALIGIKQMNGDLLWDTYNITNYTKLGCQLLPSSIDLNISNFKFSHIGINLHYHVIEATIFLPLTYDVSRINHVWQVGDIAVGKEVKMHPKALRNYDSTETINLKTCKGRGNRVHRSRRIREVHGILNIIGWGTLLPIGVIISRNFRGFPLHLLGWKKYHISCQTVGYLVGSTGWAVGIWLGRQSKYYSFPKHGTYGIIIFTFATIQMLFVKFKLSDHGKFRVYRNIFHHVLGYSLLVVSCINILKGIKITHLDSKYWKQVYLGIAGCLAFIFLVFEIVSWYKFLCNKFGLQILCASEIPKEEPDSKIASTEEGKVQLSNTPENN